MRRFVQLCEVCQQLGPYGFYALNADGSHGRLWACETHSDEVKARAAASLVPAVRGPPVESVEQQQQLQG